MPRFLLILALCVAGASASAQFRNPIKRLPGLERLPGLGRFLDNPPLTTSGLDAVLEAPPLDGFNPASFKRLIDQPRSAGGSFVLAPGAYAFDAESYCLHMGTRGPVSGDGFLSAPLQGPMAPVVRSILRNAAHHPDIKQRDIQVLLWGLLARVKVTELNPHLRSIAARLLTTQELRSVSESAWDLLETNAARRAIRELPQPVQRLLRLENDMRNAVRRVNYDYRSLERLAMTPIPGLATHPTRNLPRGRWMHHANGFLIRYASAGYPQTRVEIYVPEPFTYQRDPLGRILSVKDRAGNGVESTYDDTVPPRSVPGDAGLRAYAFRTVTYVRNTPSGPQRHAVSNPGWTFVRGRQAPRRGDLLLRPAAALPTANRPVPQGSFEGLKERYEQAREHYDRYRYYRERRDRMESKPDESAIDDLENNEHYRDGVDAATRGDAGERLDWIIQQKEREREALRHATSVIDSLPTGSPDRDWAGRQYEPPDDMAIPASAGSQRLGISTRGR